MYVYYTYLQIASAKSGLEIIPDFIGCAEGHTELYMGSSSLKPGDVLDYDLDGISVYFFGFADTIHKGFQIRVSLVSKGKFKRKLSV